MLHSTNILEMPIGVITWYLLKMGLFSTYVFAAVFSLFATDMYVWCYLHSFILFRLGVYRPASMICGIACNHVTSTSTHRKCMDRLFRFMDQCPPYWPLSTSFNFMGEVGNIIGHVGNFMVQVRNSFGQVGNLMCQDGTFVWHAFKIDDSDL